MQKFSTEPEVDVDDRRYSRTPLRTRLRGVTDWLGDFFRLWWGFFALNARKTYFRYKHGQVRCPCQNPSDSGLAWQTGCDPVTAWSDPARFRRLCPLLKKTPEGFWRCSVNAADVRPFWGRAFGYLFGGLLPAYLACALLVFLFLRTVGYPVPYRAVAWPLAWHEIAEARARMFFGRAEASMQAKNSTEAMMWLSQSYRLDTRNYAVGRMLAQLLQTGWPDLSDRVYAKLMSDHPAQRHETALSWFCTILVRGDFATLKTFVVRRMADDPAHAMAWLHALIFASRQTGDSEILQKEVQSASGLPSYVGQICALELQLRAAGRDETRRLLLQPLPPSPEVYQVYYRIDRLIHNDLADDALVQLDRYGGRLGDRDRAALYLETHAALNWQGVVLSDVDEILRSPGLNSAVLELLCAHIIRHPDAKILGKLFEALDKNPPPADVQHLGDYSALFCAVGAAGDRDRMDFIAGMLKSITGSEFKTLMLIQAFFRGESPDMPIERYLPALPALPIEVSYAMFERYGHEKQAMAPH